MENPQNVFFDILIDESFTATNNDPSLNPIDNKRILSLVNDFEEGKWRSQWFDDFVWDNICLTCLTNNERKNLVNRHKTALRQAAKKLRFSETDKIGNGSEIAEIILYGVMKEHYKALSVVPKIFYKQNVQDNAKGADSVHLTISNNDFSIWFGESKFYNDISDARLSDIIESVGNSLHPDKIRKENSIIINIKELNDLEIDPSIRSEILGILSPDTSIDKIKPKLNIPILLIHECEITRGCTEMTDQYKNEMINYHKGRAQSYFSKQINKLSEVIYKYKEIKFHIILLPVPYKNAVVDKFIQAVTYHKAA